MEKKFKILLQQKWSKTSKIWFHFKAHLHCKGENKEVELFFDWSLIVLSFAPVFDWCE